MARENFYIILELPFDPPEENQEVINRAIEKKRLEWSKGATDFRNGPVYRAYSAMLPEIRKIMSDPIKRKSEYEEAYRIMYARARHMLTIIEKRGYLYESEIRNISKRLHVGEEMIRKACKVRIVVDETTTTSIKKPKGADRFQVLEVYLKTLNKKDYYDFINYNGTLLQGASTKRLRDMPCYRIQDLIKGLKVTYAKNTPEESAVEKLCAECERVFASDTAKKEYDEYLVWKNTEDIFEQVQIATELTKVLEKSQCAETIKLLSEVTGNKEKAVDLLKEYCKQNGIAMEYVNSVTNPSTMQQRMNRMENRRTVVQNIKKEQGDEESRDQPNMPKNLKVHVDTMKCCNYLSWEKTTQDPNVSYLIVRKRGNPPRNINDGELLGTISVSNYTDATIYPGKIYFYAVFAVKRGVYSKGICTQVGYINLFEVQEAMIAVIDGFIEIDWTQNYRECRVAIFRQQGNPPIEYGEGKLCYNASQMHFRDKEVTKPGTYYYRIYTTIYVNGKRYHSKGVVLSATIEEEKKKAIFVSKPPMIEKKEEKNVLPEQGKVVGKEGKREPPLPPMRPNPYMTPLKRVEDQKYIIYDIRVKRGFFKSKAIEIIFEGKSENFELPPLLIIAGKGYPPIYKTAGTLIGTIEKRFVHKSYVHVIPLSDVEGQDYIKLFLANASDEGQYELHLKLGSSSNFTI